MTTTKTVAARDAGQPMADQPGSAMHIHQSVLDLETGRNVFSTGNGRDSALFRSYIAGLARLLPQVCPLFAPNVNSFRRMRPDTDAPINVQWGYDNRTCGLRVPMDTPENTRVESRFAGSDANPYLAMAGTLACGLFGIREKLQPTEPLTISAQDVGFELPRSLGEALDQLETCTVLHDLLAAFPATLELATLALVIGAVFGVIAGVLCARYAGSPWDFAVRTLTLLGNSVPIFWLGLLMLALFYAKLQWSPGPGRLDDIYQFTIEPKTGFALIDTWLSGDKEAFRNAFSHLVLPVLLLAYYSLASITRLTRSACLSEMNKEYILLARAKGAGEMTILLRHVLPKIRSTLLTVIALAYTSMLEGAVLTETVFSWPGIGRYLTTALFAGDTTAIMGGTLLIGVCFVLINNLTDLLVRFTDPRVR